MGKLYGARRRLIAAAKLTGYSSGVVTVFTILAAMGNGGVDFWLFPALMKGITGGIILSGIMLWLAWLADRWEWGPRAELVSLDLLAPQVQPESIRRQQAQERGGYPVPAPAWPAASRDMRRAPAEAAFRPAAAPTYARPAAPGQYSVPAPAWPAASAASGPAPAPAAAPAPARAYVPQHAAVDDDSLVMVSSTAAPESVGGDR